MATSKDAILAELADIATAKSRIYKIGASSQIPGAIGTSQANLDALLRRERELRGKLLRAGGAPCRLRPNYLPTSARDWED